MNLHEQHEFERLAEAHREALVGHALRMVRNRDDAEDLVQSALVRAARKFASFEGGNFRAWAMRIVTREHLNARQRTRPATEPFEEDETRSPGPSALESLTDAEVAPEVLSAIGELPEIFGRVFLLAEFAGLSNSEIAAAEGIPKGTVQSRKFRVREYLRGRLAAYAREAYGVET